MKKIFTILTLITFTAPVFAACSITGGACSVSSLSQPSLQEKYAPNHLENLQKTDAFNPKYVTPYYDMLINTDEPTAQNPTTDNAGYNSNCQFGVCLPGVQPSTGIFD